ncbi:MAG TPA: nucleotidyltransferase domain-containing protein, partial [Erysipelotrichaceae bacterium]|nr:nucleotidyltransferase domain-containing protein [Erysipelotrichaceae bacterium]
EKVRLKKYFYILRSLAAALYAVRKDDIPPIEFDVLRSSEFPWEMNVIIDEMVRIKKENDESRQIERIVELDIFIENMLKEINDNIQQFQQAEAASWQDLNRFFRKVVKNK